MFFKFFNSSCNGVINLGNIASTGTSIAMANVRGGPISSTSTSTTSSSAVLMVGPNFKVLTTFVNKLFIFYFISFKKNIITLKVIRIYLVFYSH